MKSLSLALALSAFALATPALHADDISASLTTGLGTDTLIETPILNGEQFTYTNETLGLLTTENVLNSSTSTFIATYTDVSPSLAILNVDDICVNVTVAGPVVPCQAFAFSFTDVTLPDISIVVALNASLGVAGDVANFDIADGSLAGGGGTFELGPAPAATPEPSSLCLMATGLAAAAGMVRRRIAQTDIA